jgi:signal transduction histidine kinase
MNNETTNAIESVCREIEPEELRRAIMNLLFNALKNQFRENDIRSVIELMQLMQREEDANA